MTGDPTENTPWLEGENYEEMMIIIMVYESEYQFSRAEEGQLINQQLYFLK